jgi:cyclopropane fatty-acyl-phospholipid synthase-like methyltransferase
MEKRFCQATENNKEAILAALKTYFADSLNVLEIGSGTGQHAVHFAPQLSHLTWVMADLPVNHETINAWVSDFPADNIHGPLDYEVGENAWPATKADAVFSANTAHIMQPEISRLMMTSVADNLPAGGVFCLYGPFNIDGQYTSEGNESFDAHLTREGCGGIRDIAELQGWVVGKGLLLEERITMPANNFLLVWRKQ